MQRHRALLIAIALIVCAPVGVASRVDAAPIDDAVRDALVRLEQQTTDPLLLPAPRMAPVEESIVDRRRLAIARSVLTMHAQIDTTIAVLEGDVLTMLSISRNTRHLGLRRRALRMYELTVLADRQHRYTREILEERAQCALELGDSTEIAELALEIVGRKDAGTYGATLAASLEFLAADAAIGVGVRQLVDRLQSTAQLVDPACWILIAQVRQRLGEHETAQRIYRDLLLRQRGLDAHQLAIALMGLADSAHSMGDVARAMDLYRSYRARSAGRLSAWSTYQLGNMAASRGEFGDAVSFLRSICEREEPTPWRESACARLAQVRQLQAIEAELRPYGRDLSRQRQSR